MSIEAMKWARMADVQKSSSKAILLNLAMLVRYDAQEWTVFASIEYLAQVTHLNRKTVIDALARLRELGVLQDTGRRAGDNRSSIVYRLCPNAVPLIDLRRTPGIAAGDTRQAPQSDQDFDQRPIYSDPSQEEEANDWVLETNPLPPFDEEVYASPSSSQLDLPASASYSAYAQDAAKSNVAVGNVMNSCASLNTEAPQNRPHPKTSAYSGQRVSHRARLPRAAAGAGATRLPAGWVLPEHWRVWTQRARPQWSSEKLDAMATTFCAYMRSRPGHAGLSGDWFESWRLWVFREWEPKASCKPWHTSWSGIVAKGKALGLTQAPNEPEAHFKVRIFQAANLPLPH